MKGLLFLMGYGWLLFGCGGSLWMCYWRNEGNYVPSTTGTMRDEEEMIGGDVEVELEMDEEEGREGDALLNGRSSQDTNREEGGGKRRNGRTRAIQVKSDGTKRFCRKVSSTLSRFPITLLVTIVRFCFDADDTVCLPLTLCSATY